MGSGTLCEGLGDVMHEILKLACLWACCRLLQVAGGAAAGWLEIYQSALATSLSASLPRRLTSGDAEEDWSSFLDRDSCLEQCVTLR